MAILPNFLVIGAAKAGTTSLYYYLKQHPQIYMPLSKEQKEPDFFALEGEPLEYPGPHGIFKLKNPITNLQTYSTLFNPVTTETAIGEASTVYIYSAKACERIHHYLPEVKLIAILRDPVERAYSHYLFWASQGFEPDTDLDFAKAIALETQRIEAGWSHNWHYLARGFYYVQLQRYFDRFDSHQIRIYLYEDLLENPAKLLQDIFRFLGVEDSFQPDIAEIHNKTEVAKNLTLNALLNRPNLIKAIVKSLLPKGLRQNLATTIKQYNKGKPKLSPKIRKQLIAVYREDILKLQDLIGRDLSKWLE